MRIRILALICSFSVILSTVLAGCGGGGGEGGSGAPPAAEDTSDAATRQALQTTNLGVAPGSPAVGTLKRWNLLIPVKTKGDARAVQAMDRIEDRLDAIIFDRTAIAGTPDDDITRGLIISLGTADSTSSLC